MPVFETYFKILNSCLLYIQHVVTTLYGPWKLKNLTFLTVKETLHTNLLRTMITSRVNKNYYYTVTLFLGHVFPFVSLYFPCYIEVSLDSKLECIFSKQKIPEGFSKHFVLFGQV